MPPYAPFGRKLTAMRLAVGIAHQAELAEKVGSTQQTVSRWESGQSRPRLAQIPAIASVLNVDAYELSRLAGYGVSPVLATFDQPFPVDSLGPESFERFCFFLLRARYRGANVNRYGGTGHDQAGIDIEVALKDDTRIDFQCKRVEEFGAASVRDAIKAYERNATQKVILLSRVASPKARNAIAEFKSWAIWDKEDISAEIRRLPKVEQILLVDTFFRGQRLALLGETEPSVWQTTEQFYAPFFGGEGFTHDWDLVGRGPEIGKLVDALASKSINLVLLAGTAGAGKSRVLKQAIKVSEKTLGSDVLIRFLSSTGTVTSKSLEDLGVGAKLLVVDDAHDRQDLAILFQFVATTANNAKLLLALRPYGLDVIKQQAAAFSLFDPRIAAVDLNGLSLEQATELAEKVLAKFDGDRKAARSIASLTLECPLITVMGASVVAKEGTYVEFAGNDASFRSRIMASFSKIVMGQASTRDAEAVRRFLAVAALTQPFNIENPAFLEICAAVESISAVEAPRLFRELVNAGVLFQRGDYYRIAPDLLSDFIIEAECIDRDGRSTGYAEKVFEVADSQSRGDGRFVKQIVLNLGRLDWRRANGDPVNSKLLDQIWAKLTPTEKYGDPHLEAVKGVAYYQPSRAVAFAEGLCAHGAYLNELPPILKLVAYSAKYLTQACDCLWEIGRGDSRETGPHPDHPIRVLADLAAVQNGKPLAYSDLVVDFAISLFGNPDNWDGTYSPLDVLAGAIRTEGDNVSFIGQRMTLAPYHVRPDVVRKLRIRIRDAVIDLLFNADVSIAVRAAAFFRSMLVYPMGILNNRIPDDVYQLWTEEFIETLDALLAVCRSGKLDRLVHLEIARSASWHAHSATLGTETAAKKIVASQPRDLAFRLSAALVDPFGKTNEKVRTVPVSEWTKEVKSIADTLVDDYAEGDALRIKIEEHLGRIRQAKIKSQPNVLVRELLQRSRKFASSIVETALRDPCAPIAQFVASALGTLLQEDSSLALSLSDAMISSGDTRLAVAVATGHGWLDFNREADGKHLALVRTLAASDHLEVVDATLRAIEQIAAANAPAALSIINEIKFDRFLQVNSAQDVKAAEHFIDQVYQIFRDDGGIPFSTLSDDEVGTLLVKLLPARSLDGYWVQTFLSNASEFHAMRCARFLRDRVEIAADKDDWSYRACDLGYAHVPLRFRAAPEFSDILGMTFRWIRSRPEFMFESQATALFAVIAKPFDHDIVDLLDRWIPTSDKRDIEIMSGLLRGANHSFVFDNIAFVSRFLSAARGFGPETLKIATSGLYDASMLGPRSGVAGQPFARDVDSKREAEDHMKHFSRSSPEHQLFRAIRDGADREVATFAKRAEAKADLFDD